jgi:hypothetical protein
MDRALHHLGSLAARRPWAVVAGWLLSAVLAVVLAGTVGGTLTDTYDMPGTDSQAATDLLRDRFPAFAGSGAHVVVHRDDGALDPGVLADVATRLTRGDHVEAVEQPRTSPDGRTALIQVRYDVPVTAVDEVAAVADLRRAAQPAAERDWQVEVGGEVPDQVYEQGLAEVVGFAAAAVVLLVAFGSVVSAGLPLAMAAVGLGIGMSLVTLVALMTSVSTLAPTVASMVGIGVGIDYALLIVSRHRAELLAGADVATALRRAVGTAGRSVVFAGGTVLVAICGLAFSGVPNFVMIGVATAVVVLVAVLAAVTLLPALLRLVGLRVLGRRTRRQLAAGTWRAPSRTPLSGRWATRTARHPWRFATGGLLLLLLLCAPVLDMRLGQSDAGSEPTLQHHAPRLRPGRERLRAGRQRAAARGGRRGGRRRRRAGAARPPRRDARGGRGRAARDRPGRERRAADRGAGDGPPGPGDRRPRARAAGGGAAHRGLGHREHRRLHGLQPAPAGPAAARHRHGRPDQPAAAGPGVPVGGRPAQGRGPEPAVRGGGVRRRRRAVPVGLGRVRPGTRRPGAHQRLRADVPVRHPVRPEHGLRGVPARAGPGALGGHRRPRSAPSWRASPRPAG